MTFLEEGYRLQEYEIKRALGQGGFGITYLAIDTNLEKEVAIKEFFPRELVDRDEITNSISLQNVDYDNNKKKLSQKRYKHFLKKFKAEAQIMSKIEHPNIVKVVRIFQANNTSYFVMDYIKGESLGKYIKRVGSLTQEQIVETMMPILEGLKVVHSKSFLHRDIAPDNIILAQNGKAMLIDFGAAKNTIKDSDGIEFSIGVIKNGYSAPEQHSDDSIHSASTDIYALGAVFAFIVSGGKIPPIAPKRLLEREREPLKEFLEKYSEKYTQGFINAIIRAMSLNPKNRFQEIFELQKALITKRISLKEYTQISENRLNQEEIIQIAILLLNKLEGLHYNDSIHGNLSPENIYIKDKTTIELGGRKEFTKHNSQSLASVANIGYSAPEQYSSDLKYTPSTDTYAVGAVIFFMITNQHPTEATRRLTEHYSGEDSLQTICHTYSNLYSKKFLKIILKSMHLNPKNRFKEITEFENELKKLKIIKHEEILYSKKLFFSFFFSLLLFLGFYFKDKILKAVLSDHNNTLSLVSPPLKYIKKVDSNKSLDDKNKILKVVLDEHNISLPKVSLGLKYTKKVDSKKQELKRELLQLDNKKSFSEDIDNINILKCMSQNCIEQVFKTIETIHKKIIEQEMIESLNVKENSKKYKENILLKKFKDLK